ncbi:cytochrome c3 family protein [bacterium]|nr:cytochrome c3 family protein [bacterium]
MASVLDREHRKWESSARARHRTQKNDSIASFWGTSMLGKTYYTQLNGRMLPARQLRHWLAQDFAHANRDYLGRPHAIVEMFEPKGFNFFLDLDIKDRSVTEDWLYRYVRMLMHTVRDCVMSGGAADLRRVKVLICTTLDAEGNMQPHSTPFMQCPVCCDEVRPDVETGLLVCGDCKTVWRRNPQDPHGVKYLHALGSNVELRPSLGTNPQPFQSTKVKSGIHVRFKNLVMDRDDAQTLALAIRQKSIAFDNTIPPSEWWDIVDLAPYKSSVPSLRMCFMHKGTKCTTCHGKKTLSIHGETIECDKCYGRGSIAVNKRYEILDVGYLSTMQFLGELVGKKIAKSEEGADDLAQTLDPSICKHGIRQVHVEDGLMDEDLLKTPENVLQDDPMFMPKDVPLRHVDNGFDAPAAYKRYHRPRTVADYEYCLEQSSIATIGPDAVYPNIILPEYLPTDHIDPPTKTRKRKHANADAREMTRNEIYQAQDAGKKEPLSSQYFPMIHDIISEAEPKFEASSVIKAYYADARKKVIWANLDGVNSNYCVNKKGYHASSRSFAIIDVRCGVRIKCFCRKEGCCRWNGTPYQPIRSEYRQQLFGVTEPGVGANGEYSFETLVSKYSFLNRRFADDRDMKRLRKYIYQRKRDVDQLNLTASRCSMTNHRVVYTLEKMLDRLESTTSKFQMLRDEWCSPVDNYDVSRPTNEPKAAKVAEGTKDRSLFACFTDVAYEPDDPEIYPDVDVGSDVETS